MKFKIIWVLFLILSFGFLLKSAEGELAPESIDQVRYEIWAELDDANKMLYGKEDVVWINKTTEEIQDMWFHLYYNAFKNELSTMIQESKEEGLLGIKILDVLAPEEDEWGWIDVTSIKLVDGQDLKPTMEFVPHDEPLRPEDQTVMRVLFPEPIKPGEEVHLQIEFQLRIPRTITRSGYYQNSYFLAQWFPKPGVYEEGRGWNCHEYHLSSEFYADFADFTVHMTVPTPFVIGASGKQIKSITSPDGNTRTYTFHQKGIHDFAWTANPDFIKVERNFVADQEISPEEYEDIAQRLALPVESVKLSDVKMILLIEPEHENQIERHFKALRMAIKYYGIWYGPYPYETITMVDPPFRTGSGGMEYPTLFTAGTRILRSKKVLSPEGVIVHEFGHGYWYGLCANNEFEEAWLDEGITTYSTGKVLAEAYGPSALQISINRIPAAYFFSLTQFYDYMFDRAAGIQVVELDPITTFSWKFYSLGSYGLNVYMRASTCLYTLERLVGEDSMLRILRTFQMRFRYKHPQTSDFVQVVNEITGRDFTWFFEELFFNTLNFDYGISSLISYQKKKHIRGVFDIDGQKELFTEKKVNELEAEEEKSDSKKIYVTEVVIRRFGEARMDGDASVAIKIIFEDGSEEVVLWDGQLRWKKFLFEKPSKAKVAQLDPDNVWLIDSNITNNSLKRKPSKKGVFHLTNKLFFWIQNYLQFMSALS